MMFLWMVMETEINIGINSGWKAAIDLGTNTFQLAIKDKNQPKRLLHSEKIGVKIGRGGMNRRMILPEAGAAAVETLHYFVKVLAQYDLKPSDCLTIGTSAFRNAANAPEIVGLISEKTGFSVRIISGQQEADLIFEGVKASGALNAQNHNLIMDIGGGSVEFILCKGELPIWKQSFETGGLRLIEKTGNQDPLFPSFRKELNLYLQREWEPLWEKLQSTSGIIALVGCSGAFETFASIYAASKEKMADEGLSPVRHIPVPFFHFLKQHLFSQNLEERLRIMGMEPIRAEMIPYAALMVDLMLDYVPAQYIVASTYSLKEGVLFGG